MNDEIGGEMDIHTYLIQDDFKALIQTLGMGQANDHQQRRNCVIQGGKKGGQERV